MSQPVKFYLELMGDIGRQLMQTLYISVLSVVSIVFKLLSVKSRVIFVILKRDAFS